MPSPGGHRFVPDIPSQPEPLDLKQIGAVVAEVAAACGRIAATYKKDVDYDRWNTTVESELAQVGGSSAALKDAEFTKFVCELAAVATSIKRDPAERANTKPKLLAAAQEDVWVAPAYQYFKDRAAVGHDMAAATYTAAVQGSLREQAKEIGGRLKAAKLANQPNLTAVAGEVVTIAQDLHAAFMADPDVSEAAWRAAAPIHLSKANTHGAGTNSAYLFDAGHALLNRDFGSIPAPQTPARELWAARLKKAASPDTWNRPVGSFKDPTNPKPRGAAAADEASRYRAAVEKSLEVVDLRQCAGQLANVAAQLGRAFVDPMITKANWEAGARALLPKPTGTAGTNSHSLMAAGLKLIDAELIAGLPDPVGTMPGPERTAWQEKLKKAGDPATWEAHLKNFGEPTSSEPRKEAAKEASRYVRKVQADLKRAEDDAKVSNNRGTAPTGFKNMGHGKSALRIATPPRPAVAEIGALHPARIVYSPTEALVRIDVDGPELTYNPATKSVEVNPQRIVRTELAVGLKFERIHADDVAQKNHELRSLNELRLKLEEQFSFVGQARGSARVRITNPGSTMAVIDAYITEKRHGCSVQQVRLKNGEVKTPFLVKNGSAGPEVSEPRLNFGAKINYLEGVCRLEGMPIALPPGLSAAEEAKQGRRAATIDTTNAAFHLRGAAEFENVGGVSPTVVCPLELKPGTPRGLRLKNCYVSQLEPQGHLGDFVTEGGCLFNLMPGKSAPTIVNPYQRPTVKPRTPEMGAQEFLDDVLGGTKFGTVETVALMAALLGQGKNRRLGAELIERGRSENWAERHDEFDAQDAANLVMNSPALILREKSDPTVPNTRSFVFTDDVGRTLTFDLEKNPSKAWQLERIVGPEIPNSPRFIWRHGLPPGGAPLPYQLQDVFYQIANLSQRYSPYYFYHEHVDDPYEKVFAELEGGRRTRPVESLRLDESFQDSLWEQVLINMASVPRVTTRFAHSVDGRRFQQREAYYAALTSTGGGVRDRWF